MINRRLQNRERTVGAMENKRTCHKKETQLLRDTRQTMSEFELQKEISKDLKKQEIYGIYIQAVMQHRQTHS